MAQAWGSVLPGLALSPFHPWAAPATVGLISSHSPQRCSHPSSLHPLPMADMYAHLLQGLAGTGQSESGTYQVGVTRKVRKPPLSN